uniref:Uncharacterized protein n=1 Tax=Arundo donax TaxID=35708 RepID=A0A0A8YSE6_ARUDO
MCACNPQQVGAIQLPSSNFANPFMHTCFHCKTDQILLMGLQPWEIIKGISQIIPYYQMPFYSLCFLKASYYRLIHCTVSKEDFLHSGKSKQKRTWMKLTWQHTNQFVWGVAFCKDPWSMFDKVCTDSSILVKYFVMIAVGTLL